MSTMLGVRLGEHHQFDIGRIPRQGTVALKQVVELILRQGQAQTGIGRIQRRPSLLADQNPIEGLGTFMSENPCLFTRQKDLLGHAVMQLSGEEVKHLPILIRIQPNQGVANGALNPDHGVKSADLSNVRRLARPGRSSTETRHDQHIVT